MTAFPLPYFPAFLITQRLFLFVGSALGRISPLRSSPIRRRAGPEYCTLSMHAVRAPDHPRHPVMGIFRDDKPDADFIDVLHSTAWLKFGLQIGGRCGYTARVRKRLLIGAILAVVIGVVGWVAYEPDKGTVDWHKKKYLRARKQPKIEEWINFHMAGMVPGTRQLADALSSSRDSKAKRHQRALIDAGYLKEAPVALFKPLPFSELMQMEVRLDDLVADDTLALTMIRPSASNGALFVIAPAMAFEQITNVVREAYKADSN
jgi:hypothetical protein